MNPASVRLLVLPAVSGSVVPGSLSAGVSARLFRTLPRRPHPAFVAGGQVPFVRAAMLLRANALAKGNSGAK